MTLSPRKRCKTTTPCVGFYYGKNSDLLSLYKKYKKEDDVNAIISICFTNGRWTIYSTDYMEEAINKRNSTFPYQYACKSCLKCFSIRKIKGEI